MYVHLDNDTDVHSQHCKFNIQIQLGIVYFILINTNYLINYYNFHINSSNSNINRTIAIRIEKVKISMVLNQCHFCSGSLIQNSTITKQNKLLVHRRYQDNQHELLIRLNRNILMYQHRNQITVKTQQGKQDFRGSVVEPIGEKV